MSWTLSDGMHEQMGYKNKTLHVIFIVHQLCNSANRDLYKSAQQTRASQIWMHFMLKIGTILAKFESLLKLTQSVIA